MLPLPRRCILYSFLVGSFILTTAEAQYRLEITKPPGLVRLDTEIVAEDYVWFIFSPPATDFVTTNNKKTLVFAACSPGTSYSVALIAIDYTNKTSIQQSYVVKISGEPVPPGPEPPSPPNPPNPPGPEPEPNFPPGTYNLAKFAYDTAKLIPSSQDKATKVTLLADNFQAVTSAISAGVITTVNEANNDLRNRNRTIFPNGPGDWSGFFSSFANKMLELDNNDQNWDVQKLKVALLEIEMGLRAVK